jgi:hypothetical protein
VIFGRPAKRQRREPLNSRTFAELLDEIYELQEGSTPTRLNQPAGSSG